MEDYNKQKKDFISYMDDDGQIKNQFVVIIKKDISGVSFKFNKNDYNTIFIPNHRILKIKYKEEEDVSN